MYIQLAKHKIKTRNMMSKNGKTYSLQDAETIQFKWQQYKSGFI